MEEGDEVPSANPYTGEISYKKVIATTRSETDTIVLVRVNGEELETTEIHPFWVEERGFVPAYALKKGDILRLADGSNTSVESVEILHLEEAVWVYNFTVEDNHTYFVGDSGVWVHNSRCGKSSARNAYMGRTPSKKSKTGKAVIERMKKEHKVTSDGKFFMDSNKKWHSINEADMAHKVNAVDWWNDTGRFYGAKAKEVREWMLDSNNYYLEHYSINRSQGNALKRMGKRYKPPAK